MLNSQSICAQAVKDRLLAILHDSAVRADLSVEVCFDVGPNGSSAATLVLTSRSVPLPAGKSVNELLRALQDQTELLMHDIQDFDAQLHNVKMSDTETGIYLVKADNLILFASTCQVETEDFVADHVDLLRCEQSFVAVPLEDIPQTLRELAAKNVDVPEYRIVKRGYEQIA